MGLIDMSNLNRDAARELIERNIRQFGYHVYIVAGGPLPRVVYTIGLSDRIGAELLLAGGVFYTADDARRIIERVQHQLHAGGRPSKVDVDGLGAFTLQAVHGSWRDGLLLGAVDYYRGRTVEVLQITPDEKHVTSDVPNAAREWNPQVEPVWQWLKAAWPFAVPSTATATTNLEALQGRRVTEAVRWGEDEWEMFSGAGPDVPEDAVRVVPLGSLLAADSSLLPVLDLEVGRGLWRDERDGPWNRWERKGTGGVD